MRRFFLVVILGTGASFAPLTRGDAPGRSAPGNIPSPPAGPSETNPLPSLDIPSIPPGSAGQFRLLPSPAASTGPAPGAIGPAASGRPRPSAPDDAPNHDAPVRRAQAGLGDMMAPLGSNPFPAMPTASQPDIAGPVLGGQSISLQTALYGALTSNPDLVSLRQGNVPGNAASPEAVEVARRLPTTLNPTLWIDYRPINLIPRDTFGSGSPAGSSGGAHQPFYSLGQNYIYLSLRQPIELGHQTRYRYRDRQGGAGPAALEHPPG